MSAWTGGLAAALVATTGAQALATLAVFVLPVLAPAAAADLGVPARWVGYQVAAVYLPAALVSALAGGVLRRFGPARTTQIALGAAAAGCLVVALGGLPGAAAGSALVGLGYGLTNPAASQVLGRLAPPMRRNLVFSVKQSGVPLGAALAGLALPALALFLGWRAAAGAVAAALALAAAGLGAFRPAWDTGRDPAAPLSAGAGGGMALLRARPGLAGLAATAALFSAVQLSLGAYAVTMLVEEFGWGAVAAGAAAGAAQISGAAGRLLWAALADRWGVGLRVLAGIGAGTAAAAAALPLAVGGWPDAAVLGLLCVLGACAAGWNGVLVAEAVRLAPAGEAGAAAGGVLAAAFAGVVAGPSVFALAVAWLGSYATAFAALAVLPLLGAAIAWRTHRREAAASVVSARL